MGRRLFLLALVGCLTAVGALWVWRWRATPPVTAITTARDILALSAQAAEDELPVSLADGVVTSFDPEIRLIFVHDATARRLRRLARAARVETTQRIRQREHDIALGRASSAGASFQRTPHPHMPIVATTAHVMESDRDACVAAGMDAFLSKPIAASELLDVMSRLRPQVA